MTLQAVEPSPGVPFVIGSLGSLGSLGSSPRFAPHALYSPLVVCLLTGGCTRALDRDRCEVYAADIVDFSPGEGAGFGQDRLPDVVLGPPQGAPEGRGATDVLSLGTFGSITVALAERVLDAPGLAELVVFENPFVIAGTDVVYAEWGEVAVSDDGETFIPFPCDANTGEGCAGRTPVGEEGSLLERGGDPFDLSDIGLGAVRYVRISDVGAPARPLGAGADGFDLDGVGAVNIHGAPHCRERGSPSVR